MKNRYAPSARALHRALFWMALSTTLVVESDAAADRTSGDISGSVTVLHDGEKKKDRSSVVIYLRNGPKAPPESAKVVQRVYQRDKQFTPNVVVAPLGSSIDFPNEDKIFHNVFSLSKAARFDLGLYKNGASKSITAKKVGVIDLFCNIHPQMFAKIVVVDTTYYAMTESDGRFTIPAVPPGTYDLVAWQPRGKELVTQVTVTRGKRSELKLELVESGERERHGRKDGTPYGRYE